MVLPLFLIMSCAVLVAWYIMWQFHGLWLSAHTSGVPVSYPELIAMKLRRTDVRQVVVSYIRCSKANLDVSLNAIETHHLSGGNVARVVSALITAKGAGLPLTWDEARALDLKGEDVLSAVQASVRLKQAGPVQG